MASSPYNNPTNPAFTPPSSSSCFDPSNSSTPNTTFVQADPSNFRAVVQRLTGVENDPTAQKLPVSLPTRNLAGKSAPSAGGGEMGPRRPAFKLHERRQSARKLEIKLNNNNPNNSNNNAAAANNYMIISGPLMGSPSCVSSRQRIGEMVMASPVSTLDYFFARGSPRTPMSTTSSSSPEEEEERAIAEKGFYLHPSPLSTPRGSDPPELLPLFPLHSPTSNSTPS